MPNWRQNLLSAGESLSLTENLKKNDNANYNNNCSNSLSRIITPVTVVPNDAFQQKANTGSRRPSKHAIADIPQIMTNTLQYGSEKKFSYTDSAKPGFFCRESNLSADFSSFLTDSSSFADYEDRRGSVSNLEDPPLKINYIEHEEAVVERIALSQNVFCMPSQYHQLNSNNTFSIDDISDGSDCVSTSTCDSFERCEFDCKDFEPFSDTCCCDPNSDGGCARSPKLLDFLADEQCISPVYREEDGISTRSDMDGLDLTLFEPAPRNQQNGVDSRDKNVVEGDKNSSDNGGNNVMVGLLHMSVENSGKGDELGVGAEWQPHFCVLLQDRGSLATYRSEDMAGGSTLPLVRVEGGSRARGGAGLRCWAAPSIAEEPTLHPESEDATSLQDVSILGELKCLSLPHGTRPPLSQWDTLGPLKSPGGKSYYGSDTDTSYEKACRNANGAGPGDTSVAQNGVQPTGSPSRLAAFFFSKRSLRASPLKRARSAAKLAPRAPLRSSRSHESLLSSPLSCGGSVRGGAVRALHASLAGRPHCFLLQLPGPPASTRHFACGSRIERDTWINSLRASLQAEGGNNVRRTERSLRLYLLEAKGLPPKKRYYCELLIDSTLYARTSSKLKTELCFWGEVFEFTGLPQVNVITIDIYREPDRKPRKRDKRFLVGSVKIPIQELTGRHQSERWHPLEPGSGAGSDAAAIAGASLRAKCRYQCLEVLPEKYYQPLLMYLRDNYSQLIEYLEPVISVKSKEEVAGALVGAVRCAGGSAAAARLLAAAAALEVRRAPHAALAFRANSLATKATEAYMKMLGETYLQETLWECVSSAMSGGCGWEVDPGRGAGGGANLRRQRARLRAAVARTWGTLLHTRHAFPQDLTLCFAAFREKLRAMQREELADHLVSASVFLRFLCPAILTPSLFGITHEYPDERAGRNLTLVAKTLQTLANFTRFQGKEAYMEFLNDFLEEEAPNMRAFLKDISTLPQGSENALQEEWGTGCPAGFLDLGKQLASLHILLADNLQRLPPAAQQELDPLPSILDQLTEDLREYAGSQGDLNLHSPSSIHDNIFRFNDPTYSPSADTTLAHSSPLLGHNTSAQINTLSSSGSGSQPDSTPASLISHIVKKSPSLGVRAATLPRNNFNNVANANNQERYTSQYNNREHCVNLKVVQLGFDKNASSPSLVNKINGSNGNIAVHSSQRSVASNRSNADAYIPARNVFEDSRNNYGSREHVFNNRNVEQSSGAMPKNLEELSDLLRYADDQENDGHHDENVNQRITNHDILPQTNINTIANGNNNHAHNNGSNVSISALSNVASSGYQSFATYSQSSSPVELYTGQQQGNYCDGSPAHQNRRPNQIAMDNRRNNYNKNNQQRFEYERQKFGIQNFTRDTGASSPRPLVNGPLTFTNPVYHIEGDQVDPNAFNQRDDNSNAFKQPSKRSISTSSSSSIEEEDDTTDNMETNSEGNFKNYRDHSTKHSRRNVRANDKQKNNAYQDVVRHSKSSVEAQSHRKLVSKSRSTGSEPGNFSIANNIESLKEHKLEPLEPLAPLRRNVNSRLPRTNPLSSYNQPKSNVIHFGQASESYQNDRANSNFNQNFNRPDSNVEETNKEMYRLQMSRSQKALYDRNNLEGFSNSNLPKLMEKYEGGTKSTDTYVSNIETGKGGGFVKNNIEYAGPLRVMENGFPLERNYSSKNMSSTRLNEELRTSENGYPLERNYSKVSTTSSGLRGAMNAEDSNNPSTLISSSELAVRRLSLEGGGGDSSSEPEDGSYPTVGRRRLPKNHRTIQQYEREIERLKCSVDKLRQKLESVELSGEPSARGADLADSKMKGIITRLLGVEEELRREQRAMAAVLNRKQRVIERQGQRLAALGAANARLLSALHHLQPELAAQPLITTDHAIIGHSEQLLNNLQADLRPLYESTHQHNRPLFQEPKIPPYRDPPPANYSAQYQLEGKDDSKKNDADNNSIYSKDKGEQYDDLRIYQSDSLKKKTDSDEQKYGLEKSPSKQFYQDGKHGPHHTVYNTDKTYDKNSAQHQLFGTSDKSPNHQYYHDKNDNIHLNNLKNIERSASNQQLYFNRDGMPLRHSDSGQHIAYQEKNMNDSDYRYQNDANRNSDPVTRNYRGQNIEITQQFIQSEHPLLPSEGHQAVVSTQPTLYYGNQ